MTFDFYNIPLLVSYNLLGKSTSMLLNNIDVYNLIDSVGNQFNNIILFYALKSVTTLVITSLASFGGVIESAPAAVTALSDYHFIPHYNI